MRAPIDDNPPPAPVNGINTDLLLNIHGGPEVLEGIKQRTFPDVSRRIFGVEYLGQLASIMDPREVVALRGVVHDVIVKGGREFGAISSIIGRPKSEALIGSVLKPQVPDGIEEDSYKQYKDFIFDVSVGMLEKLVELMRNGVITSSEYACALTSILLFNRVFSVRSNRSTFPLIAIEGDDIGRIWTVFPESHEESLEFVLGFNPNEDDSIRGFAIDSAQKRVSGTFPLVKEGKGSGSLRFEGQSFEVIPAVVITHIIDTDSIPDIRTVRWGDPTSLESIVYGVATIRK